jgi:branched-subunit amino acid ABC-type transport system permease component
MKNRMFRKTLIGAAIAAVGALPAMADSSGLPDPSTIVTTATTACTSVCVLVAGAVGFFIVVKVVKWIRK